MPTHAGCRRRFLHAAGYPGVIVLAAILSWLLLPPGRLGAADPSPSKESSSPTVQIDSGRVAGLALGP